MTSRARFLGEGLVHHGSDGDRIVIERRQDVGPMLDRNRRLAVAGDGYSPSREFRRAASIPLVVVDLWRNELGIDVFDPDQWPAVRRLLNDPDWRWLRTAPGQL